MRIFCEANLITAMKNLKFYLDKRDAKSENAPSTVKIKLTKNYKASYIATDIRVAPSQWDAAQELVVFHPKAKSLNLHLAQQMAEVEQILYQNREAFRPMTAMEIMREVRVILNPNATLVGKDLFETRFIQFMEGKERPRTREIYAATLSRIREFEPNIKRLRFADITPTWLREFDSFLAKNAPSRNARNIHLRNIRAVFNDAIDDEVTTNYPFRKFKIRPEATIKRSFTVEQLARLFTHTPEEYAIRYLDMFKLMFYLIGINAADLTALTEVRNGRVNYHRAKTNRLYSIKVEPEAKEIIDRYRGKKKLIGFSEDYTTYITFGQLMNRALHVIGKGLDAEDGGNTYGGMTTYWARHSWATVAAELEIPKETIAKALGHGGNDVTDVYIRFDDKKIDIANRKVIDYLNEHIEKLKAGN